MRDSILQEFGFCSSDHFYHSLIRPKLLSVTIPFSVIGGAVELVFGFKPIVLLAFVALLTLELATGIYAAYVEGQKIRSKRMKSFLVMLFVWLVAIFILNTFKIYFTDGLISKVFEYLYMVVILFVNAIYFKSIWENVGRIMDKKEEFKWLIGIFGKKLKK